MVLTVNSTAPKQPLILRAKIKNVCTFFILFLKKESKTQTSLLICPNKKDIFACLCSSQVRTLARTDEARGLLWLMEEEAVHPGGSEETMLERLFSYYGSAQGENKGEHSNT